MRRSLVVGVGAEGEFDVLLETATTPRPITERDVFVAAVATGLRPDRPVARALAARPVPATE